MAGNIAESCENYTGTEKHHIIPSLHRPNEYSGCDAFAYSFPKPTQAQTIFKKNCVNDHVGDRAVYYTMVVRLDERST